MLRTSRPCILLLAGLSLLLSTAVPAVASTPDPGVASSGVGSWFLGPKDRPSDDVGGGLGLDLWVRERNPQDGLSGTRGIADWLDAGVPDIITPWDEPNPGLYHDNVYDTENEVDVAVRNRGNGGEPDVYEQGLDRGRFHRDRHHDRDVPTGGGQPDHPTNPVPEPATLGLALVGLSSAAAVGARRRRQGQD